MTSHQPAATTCSTQQNQIELYDRMCDFVLSTIEGILSGAYRVGSAGSAEDLKEFLDNKGFSFVTSYINDFWHAWHKKDDQYFVDHMERMLAVKLANPYHVDDLLRILHAMTLKEIENLDLDRLMQTDGHVSLDRLEFLKKVQDQLVISFE